MNPSFGLFCMLPARHGTPGEHVEYSVPYAVSQGENRQAEWMPRNA